MVVRRPIIIVVSVLVLLIAGTAACLLLTPKPARTPRQKDTSSQLPISAQTPGEDGDATTIPQPSSPGPVSQTYPVRVFFSKHPDSDTNPGETFAVRRTSPDIAVGTFAIAELLKGPTDTEKGQGYFTTARLRGGDESTCRGRDFTLTIHDDIATLRFCRQFDHVGSVSDGQAESEIRATLLQFSNIKKVIILNRTSDCEFNLSDLNLCKR